MVLGYAFGCLQSGYVVGKLLFGTDVRDFGSGNAGTTNTLRTYGKKVGYAVFFMDALKCVFAVWIARYLICPGMDNLKLIEAITAFCVVLGHNYPFYMNFKGGKGVAATGGFMFALDIRIALIALIMFGIIFYTTRYVSVGSLAITAMFPIALLIFYPGQWALFVIGIAFAVMAWWRHKANIKRLMNGTENKFAKKK